MKPDIPDGNSRRALARFGTVAIQMGIIITLFALLGQWLDQQYQMSEPWFTIALSLLGIAASLYLMLRSINR